MNIRKKETRQERQQQRLDAGIMSEHFPEVASIVISMIYSQDGIEKSLPRTVNFYPDSYALFRIDCLSLGCVDGGFDLSDVITSMIRNRKETTKGKLVCKGGPSTDHATIVYEIAIQYA
ncbi:MAG: hypothetical protein HY754_05595 [Nitrospirae bacterium]|nr:hypothetical protein [Nitrospirota bacterium]